LSSGQQVRQRRLVGILQVLIALQFAAPASTTSVGSGKWLWAAVAHVAAIGRMGDRAVAVGHRGKLARTANAWL
jgi:hypothetical protein